MRDNTYGTWFMDSKFNCAKHRFNIVLSTDVGQGLGISSELHFSKKKKKLKKQTKTLCRRGTSPLCKNINAILIKTDLSSPPSHYLL